MAVTVLKLVLFASGWMFCRAAIRAGVRAGAFASHPARLALHAALAVIVALFWYPEIAWAMSHAGAAGRGIGILALTAVPVGGFVLFLRWAHRRARADREGD